MSTTDDPLQRRKRQLITTAFGVNLVFGVLAIMLYPGITDPEIAQQTAMELRGSPFNYAYQFVILLVCFMWLTLDSRQLNIRRPLWLNIAIVLLTSVFVPYYLYKTRPPGLRLGAILTFFGIVFGGAFTMLVGAFLALAMAPGATPASGI